MTVKAHGQLCNVTTAVKNTSGPARTLNADGQFLLASGKRFVAFAEAMRKDPVPNAFGWKEIAPGSTANGTLFFEIPMGAAPRYLELHGSSSSPGAKVPLFFKE